MSFGHGHVFRPGAYRFALLMQRTGMPIPAAFALTLAMCAVLGLIVGAICATMAIHPARTRAQKTFHGSGRVCWNRERGVRRVLLRSGTVSRVHHGQRKKEKGRRRRPRRTGAWRCRLARVEITPDRGVAETAIGGLSDHSQKAEVLPWQT